MGTATFFVQKLEKTSQCTFSCKASYWAKKRVKAVTKNGMAFKAKKNFLSK
jgi:hypothetical protein